MIGFQDVGAALDDLMVLMVDADCEAIEILISELEFSSRARTVDVLFAWFIDVRNIDRSADAKKSFHDLMVRCLKLGEVRNVFAHSSYAHLVNGAGTPIALVRKNSRLKAGRGIREILEDDLEPESFEPHFAELRSVLEEIGRFRLKIIDWQ